MRLGFVHSGFTRGRSPYFRALFGHLEALGVQFEAIGALTHNAQGRSLEREDHRRSRGEFILAREGMHYGAHVTIPSFRFVGRLLRFKPEILLVTEYSLVSLVCVLFARVKGVKVLIFQEDAYFRLNPPWLRRGLDALRRKYRRFLGRQVDGFIANTRAAKHEIAQHLQVDDDKIFPLQLLVPASQADLCAEPLSLPAMHRRPVFVFVGQLIERKNVSLILDAAAIVKGQALDFTVLVVGNGPLANQLARKARDLKLEDIVIFHDRIAFASIGHVYAKCDVAVMPSYEDYRAVSVQEALRFGMPVIDSMHDGNADSSVMHDYNGFVFDPDSAAELAHYMSRFISEPELIESMGKRSHDYMAHRTPAAAAESLVKLLIKLTEQQLAPTAEHALEDGRHPGTRP
jgi:glycosyltransferase involved in cell wall biosynthesis